MQAEDAIGHHRRHGEVVEGVSEMFPHVGIAIFS